MSGERTTKPKGHHGSTPAAWTAVLIILSGFTIGGLALILEDVTWFWIGMALLPVGGLVGWLMSLAGFGMPRRTQ